jgi:hypothetical protein
MNTTAVKDNQAEQKDKLKKKSTTLKHTVIPDKKSKKGEVAPSILKTLKKNILLGVFVIMILFVFDSCVTKAPFLNSSVVPAARGYAKVSRDKNQNYVIHLQLLNLAEVSRLQPAKRAYIVWMVSDQEITKNLGQIISSTSRMSSKLKASFETISAFKPVKIFITAEDDASTSYPGAQVVLSTDRF